MRLFSWSGRAALATAAVAGYLTSEAVHCVRSREHAGPMIGYYEESDIVDRTVPGKLPTLPAEEIDLTCLPQKAPEEINRQTSEPPLADGPEVLRAIEYRPGSEINVETGIPAGPELPPPPPRIPYLSDDTPQPPAVLPMPEGEDEVNAYTVRQCSERPSGPVWDAVSKFFSEAARTLPTVHVEKSPPIPGLESEWFWDFDWRPMGNDEPDPINPNLGRPPTGVLPVIPEIPDPTPMPNRSGSRRPPTAEC